MSAILMTCAECGQQYMAGVVGSTPWPPHECPKPTRRELEAELEAERDAHNKTLVDAQAALCALYEAAVQEYNRSDESRLLPFERSLQHTLGTLGHAYTVDGYADLIRERNGWIKLFNRLEAAVSRHIAAKAWTDDADDALHSAHKRILKAASGSEGET